MQALGNSQLDTVLHQRTVVVAQLVADVDGDVVDADDGEFAAAGSIRLVVAVDKIRAAGLPDNSRLSVLVVRLHIHNCGGHMLVERQSQPNTQRIRQHRPFDAMD